MPEAVAAAAALARPLARKFRESKSLSVALQCHSLRLVLALAVPVALTGWPRGPCLARAYSAQAQAEALPVALAA